MAIETYFLVAAILFLLYKLGTWNYDKWEKLGVPFIKPVPFLGTRASIVLGTKTLLDLDKSNYFYFKEKGYKVGGIYDFVKPSLFLIDPEIIKNVMIKDFDAFVNHRDIVGKSNSLFGKGLFALRDQDWREMRNVLSPAFTTSKIKRMFIFINKCGQQLVDHVNHLSQQQVKQAHTDKSTVSLELKDTFTRFANDVIASSAFGIEVNSLDNPDNEFYGMSKRLTSFGIKAFFLFMLGPILSKVYTLDLIQKQVKEFFHSLIHDTIKVREEQNIVRPDMIHLLMQARKGTLKDEEETENAHLGVNNKGKLPDMSDDDITAQAVLFQMAGFLSVATFMSFSSYAIASNPDVQERLYDEIERVIEEDNGQLTYEGLMTKMTYLDMVVSETHRKYPGGASLDRQASRRYVIPASDKHSEIVLEKGDVVFIPVCGLHADPEYFPDPDKFDPERFSPENRPNIPANVYLPFGTGPRNCIGMRFALMEIKTCIVHLIRNFTFEIVSKTEKPFLMKRFSLTPLTDGLWLGFKPRVKK